MRCVVQALAAKPAEAEFTFETDAGILDRREHADGQISVDMGKPRFGWQDIPARGTEFRDTRMIELHIGPIDAPVLHSPSVANRWAIRMRSSGSIEDVWSYDLDRFGPLLENHPIFPSAPTSPIAHVDRA